MNKNIIGFLFLFALSACGDDDVTPAYDQGIDQLAISDGIMIDTGIETDSSLDDASETDTQTQSCTSCHGTPPTTGSHNRHSNYKCSTCHADVVDDNMQIIDNDKHNDGNHDVSGTMITWESSTKTCTKSCHHTETW